MDDHSTPANTVTDPVWWYVVLAILIVLAALTLFVVVEALFHALQRKWREARLQVDLQIAGGLAEIDADRTQQAEAELMLNTPKAERCLHRRAGWICIAPPHTHAPERHYFVAAPRVRAVS